MIKIVKKSKKISIIMSIIFIFIGCVFFNISKGFSNEMEEIKNNGGKYLASVISSDEENTKTTLEIQDENSPYNGDIVTTSEYSSNVNIGDIVTVYYDGKNLVMEDMTIITKIFGIIGKSFIALGIILLIVKLVKFLIKFFVLGIGLGALAQEQKTEEKFNQQFYGNPYGTQNPQIQMPNDYKNNNQYENNNQYNNEYTQN